MAAVNDDPFHPEFVTEHHPDLGPDPTADALRDLGDPNQVLPSVEYAPLPVVAAPAATHIEELDFLRYSVLLERTRRLQAERELQERAYNNTNCVLADTGVALGKLLDTLGAKYNVDFHVNRINADASISPIEQR